ncbi:MAG: hypothetical protein FWC95_00095 [Defluviitaleaceae bacterium]|nr:hypothetical protein [Defluviitaleaceae bacterium]
MGKFRDLNKFLMIGLVLDLVGFFIALFAESNGMFWTGIILVIAGIIATAIGLWICIKNKTGVPTAVFYLVLDIAFLIFLFVQR